MAINIFSGGSGGRMGAGKAPKTSKPVEVETNTGKQATSGIKKVLGTVGSIAEKYGNLIPGVGGIVSTVGKIFSKNDPEWWQNVPGTGVSTNIPLSCRTWDGGSIHSTNGGLATAEVRITRPGMVEFVSCEVRDTDNKLTPMIVPTDSMITTYLMQNVRKVVNAIPLQSPLAYKEVLVNQATAYALKHQLDKFISLTTNAKPFMPSLTDGSYDILNATNYAQLVAFRDRLAEYCKASVRLPHTLCQYLAWRYGRIYRTGTSDKCGFVLYDVVPLSATLAQYRAVVDYILGFVAKPSATYFDAGLDATVKQAAQADLFNAYLKHVVDVNIAPDTQFIYDPKEFVLRTNLDVVGPGFPTGASTEHLARIEPSPDYIYMDSSLDNKTTFMASTVSTAPKGGNALFPVRLLMVHATNIGQLGSASQQEFVKADNPLYWQPTAGAWFYFNLHFYCGAVTTSAAGIPDEWIYLVNQAAALAKSLELYNTEIYTPICANSSAEDIGYIDATAMSQDLAIVTDDIITNTHVYAFANLVYDEVTSYAAKEMPAAIAASEAALKATVDAATPSNVTVV